MVPDGSVANMSFFDHDLTHYTWIIWQGTPFCMIWFEQLMIHLITYPHLKWFDTIFDEYFDYINPFEMIAFEISRKKFIIYLHLQWFDLHALSTNEIPFEVLIIWLYTPIRIGYVLRLNWFCTPLWSEFMWTFLMKNCVFNYLKWLDVNDWFIIWVSAPLDSCECTI